MNKDDFLVIGHSIRTDTVPHWLHPATLEAMIKPCQYTHAFESHIFDIGESRNDIVQMALNLDQMTHLLFIDDDIIIPNPKSLIYMMDTLEQFDAQIVSGLYYKKQPPHEPLIIQMTETKDLIGFAFPFDNDKKPPPPDAMIKVGSVPAGFLLVKREVFEKIEKPWFVYGDKELSAKQGGALTAAAPGEDVYFSRKARRAGYNLWVNTQADLIHYCPTFIGRETTVQKFIGHKSLEGQATNINKQLKERKDERKPDAVPKA